MPRKAPYIKDFGKRIQRKMLKKPLITRRNLLDMIVTTPNPRRPLDKRSDFGGKVRRLRRKKGIKT